jgi:hypothetical protein
MDVLTTGIRKAGRDLKPERKDSPESKLKGSAKALKWRKSNSNELLRYTKSYLDNS